MFSADEPGTARKCALYHLHSPRVPGGVGGCMPPPEHSHCAGLSLHTHLSYHHGYKRAGSPHTQVGDHQIMIMYCYLTGSYSICNLICVFSKALRVLNLMVCCMQSRAGRAGFSHLDHWLVWTRTGKGRGGHSTKHQPCCHNLHQP